MQASRRVLGVDPGLTRCGVGIVDTTRARSAKLVHVSVLRTPATMPLDERLHTIVAGVLALVGEYQPQVLAVEQVFAQKNLLTVMGVAQLTGALLYEAYDRGLPTALHTPSEVKAAITGYGNAKKLQVQTMVARILGLPDLPKPADAADALALAICHSWRSGGMPAAGRQPASDTPALAAWRAAEAAATRRHNLDR